MKSIVAIIRQEKYTDVKNALAAVGCEGMGSSYCIDLSPKTRIEIVVKEEGVGPIVEAIKKGAHTGNIGDGKIFIYPIDNVIRIRTGEEGDRAV